VKNKKDSSLLLLLLLGIGVLVAFILIPAPKKVKNPTLSGQISASSLQAEQLVNKHLWMTSRTQELSQEQMRLQNQFTNPHVGDSIWPKGQIQGPDKTLGVDHSADANEATAFEDLNRYPKQLEAQNPDNVIQAQLSDEDRRQAYEQAYRAQYAKQFIENARRNGYEVRLNDQNVVISVKPLRVPNGQLGPQAE
jgi:hypothetical protein